MATVVIVPHPERPQAAELARQAIEWLVAAGHQARVPEPDAQATGLGDFGCSPEQIANGADLAVSLGGDGTMLHTVHMVVDGEVPVLGVNLGHLGYLTEVASDELVLSLERFFADDFELERRMTLEVAVRRSGDEVRERALNEAVLEKTVSGHTVRLHATVNDQPFITYASDGLIVATPTGSTAYNLSVRGPILSPGHRALVLTPVSPHMLFDRSLVLDPAETIRLDVAEPRSATLVIDGRDLGQLEPGDAIVCRAGAHDVKVVTFGSRDFHRILKAKFGLSDR